MKYTINFDRIGRQRNIDPLTVDADNADDLAAKVYRFARPRLASRDVEVFCDLATGHGWITVGFHNGGSFTIIPEGAAP